MKRVFLLSGIVLLGVAGLVQGQDGKLHGVIDFTYQSRYVWRGFDVYGEKSAIQPAVDVDFYGTGLGVRTTAHRANSGKFENAERWDYMLYYYNSLFDETPYTTEYKVHWVYYSFPDSQFRAETEIGVAYGTDVEQMREVIEGAVRGVEGVLLDKPVDIYYLKFGDSARLVRVRWWIDTYRDEKRMLDKVNAALELGLIKAGIDLPNITYDLNVNMNE